MCRLEELGIEPPDNWWLPETKQSPLWHFGLVRDLNPGPLAPEARIIPLDQRASAFVVCL